MILKRLAMLCALATIVALSLGCGLAEGDVSVPVKIENASSLGAIAFEVTYDAKVLEIVGVNKGTLAARAEAGWKSTVPGAVVVVVNRANIDGDGTLVSLEFKLLDTAGSTTLKLNIQEALENETGAPLWPQGRDGSFTGSDGSVVPPVIAFP